MAISSSHLAGNLLFAIVSLGCGITSAQSSIVTFDTHAIHGSRPISVTGDPAATTEFPPSSMTKQQLYWESLLAKTYPTQFKGLSEGKMHHESRCDQVIAQLRKIGLPVVLSSSAQDDSLAFDQPLSLELPNEPLYLRLQTALQQQNASLEIVGNRLLILSLDDIDDYKYFLNVSYDISALNISTERFIESTVNTVTPGDWIDSGQGLAVLEPMVLNGRRVVTLAHNYSGHRQFREYVRGLRKIAGPGNATAELIWTSPLTASRVIEMPGQRLRKDSGGGGFGGGGIGGGGIGGYGLGGGVF